jgi:adenylate cyclase
MSLQAIGPYEVVQKLGEGGMGTVYKARDRRLDRPVALKTIVAEMTADPSRRRRFIQEARAASALNHPNIITIYEIEEWEGSNYIAMEYIEGQTLGALAEKQGDPLALLPIFRQVAEAISVAHAAGIVHRDIKPDNVMLRPDGYVKVLDFGLARLARASEGLSETATRPGLLIGTARYMSPEQARGDTVDAPSDIFSMGVLFYELVTGAHPFFSGPAAATMFAILSQAATPPSRLNPEVPPALEDLILRMLAKEAVLRPTALDVLDELGRIGRQGIAPVPPRLSPSKRQSVGRDRERQELEAGFAAAVAGSGTLVCVVGEPGLGKTTLVEEFLEALRGDRGRAWIARGRCSERLGGTDALLPILEGLDTVLRGDSGDQAARILKRFAPTWYLQVAPSLGDSTQETLAEQARTASPERMKREFHGFLEEIARVRPVVFFLDDVHWSDESTCDLLSYLGSRCASLPVLLVATYRPSDLQAARHVFPQVKARWQGGGGSREIALEFLTRDDVERLVALRFPEHRFPGELLQLLHAKTEGNPLFLSDMLRFLRDAQVAKPQDQGWVLARDVAEVEKEIPATIRNMVQLKIDRLSEDDRKLLVAASVQGVQFDSAVVAKALGRDPAEVEERLQELDTLHGFVRMVGEQEFPDRTLTVRYRFVHVFYQNALYASLAPSRRVSLSATVAGALVGFGGDKQPARAADLAVLYEAARDSARAAPFFLAASRHTARLFAYPEAALLAQRGLKALSSLPDSDERARLELSLTVTLGVALMATRGYAATEVEAAHRRARDLCLRLGDNRKLFPATWALWVVYLIGGQLTKAMEVAEQLQAVARTSPEPANEVAALNALGITVGYRGRLREGGEHLQRSVELYDPSRHTFFTSLYVLDPMITSLCMLGRFEVVLGDLDRALGRVLEASEKARRLNHHQSIAYTTFFESWIRHERGEVDLTRERAEAAMALSKEHGLHQILEWARIARGWALCAQGKVREGVADMRRSLETQRLMHSALEGPYTLGLLAWALSRQGEHEEALRQLDEARRLIEANDERYCEAELLRLRGEVLLSKALESEVTAAREGEAPRPHQADPLLAEAAAAFGQALHLARERGTRTVELRAAVSLFRLEKDEDALKTALDRLTEGVESPLVTSARALLQGGTDGVRS